MSDKILSPSYGLFVEFQPAEDGTNRRVRCCCEYSRSLKLYRAVYVPETYTQEDRDGALWTTSKGVLTAISTHVLEVGVQRYSAKRHQKLADSLPYEFAEKAGQRLGWVL